MQLMFALDDCVVGQVFVRRGSHWWAEDPLVVANPGLFTADPRASLSYTVEPPKDAPVPDPRQLSRTAAARMGERRG